MLMHLLGGGSPVQVPRRLAQLDHFVLEPFAGLLQEVPLQGQIQKVEPLIDQGVILRRLDHVLDKMHQAVGPIPAEGVPEVKEEGVRQVLQIPQG